MSLTWYAEMNAATLPPSNGKSTMGILSQPDPTHPEPRSIEKIVIHYVGMIVYKFFGGPS